MAWGLVKVALLFVAASYADEDVMLIQTNAPSQKKTGGHSFLDVSDASAISTTGAGYDLVVEVTSALLSSWQDYDGGDNLPDPILQVADAANSQIWWMPQIGGGSLTTTNNWASYTANWTGASPVGSDEGAMSWCDFPVVNINMGFSTISIEQLVFTMVDNDQDKYDLMNSGMPNTFNQKTFDSAYDDYHQIGEYVFDIPSVMKQNGTTQKALTLNGNLGHFCCDASADGETTGWLTFKALKYVHPNRAPACTRNVAAPIMGPWTIKFELLGLYMIQYSNWETSDIGANNIKCDVWAEDMDHYTHHVTGAMELESFSAPNYHWHNFECDGCNTIELKYVPEGGRLKVSCGICIVNNCDPNLPHIGMGNFFVEDAFTAEENTVILGDPASSESYPLMLRYKILGKERTSMR